LEAVIEGLARKALPSQLLPVPEDEPASPAEERSFTLALAWAHGALKLKSDHPVEGVIALRVMELVEALGLGEWVQYWEQVCGLVEAAVKPLPPVEAAARVLGGKKFPGALEPDYLRQVAIWVAREKRKEGIRARVAGLIRLSENAKVTPQDERVILGRLRSGKPVWIRATAEEHQALVERVTRIMENGTREYIPQAWKFYGDPKRPLERLREAWLLSANMVADLIEEALRNNVPQQQEEWGNSSVSLLKEEEWRCLSLLGVDLPEDRLSTIRSYLKLVPGKLAERLGLGKLKVVVTSERPLRYHFVEKKDPKEEGGWTWKIWERALEDSESLLHKRLNQEEEFMGEAVSWADVLRSLLRTWKRFEGSEGVNQVNSYLVDLKRFIKYRRPMAQGRVIEALRRIRKEIGGQENPKLEGETLRLAQLLAMEASYGALPIFLARPRLRESALSLAYEYGMKAVLSLRSTNYHPAGLAERLARQDAAYLEELERGVIGGDERTARKLIRLRALRLKHPKATPERLARLLGTEAAWVERALEEIDPPLSLDEPFEETNGLCLGDTVAAEEDPQEELERKMLYQKVHERVGALPQHLQDVIKLHVFEGLPLEDVGFKLNLPTVEVEARLALAYNFLRYDKELMELVG